MANTNEVCSKE